MANLHSADSSASILPDFSRSEQDPALIGWRAYTVDADWLTGHLASFVLYYRQHYISLKILLLSLLSKWKEKFFI